MGIDRSWMTLKNRACNEYEKGIDTFLDFAFKRLKNVKRIRCPCAKCYNVRLKSRTEVKYNLFCNGILQNYTKWHHHGELSDESDSESDAEDVNTPIGEGRKSMETILEHLFGHEGNSTNVDIDDRECTNPEDPIPEAEKYYRLLEECKQDIYPGCKRYSKLSFLVQLLNLKCLNGWTDMSVTMLLEFLIDLLPNSAKIPKSYYEARKIIKDLGLEVKASKEAFKRQIEDLKNELKQSREEIEERESLLQREKDEREERFKKEIEEIEVRIKAQLKAEFNEQLKIIVQLYGPPTSFPHSSQEMPTTSSLPSSQGMPITSSPPPDQNDLGNCLAKEWRTTL